MKLSWKGNWNKGEVTIESETVIELNEILKELSEIEEIKDIGVSQKATLEKETGPDEFPEISSKLGCSAAIRAVLQSPWGKTEPKTMAEIAEVLETNGLYLTRGSLSGSLTYMTKRGTIRRIKKNGAWAYIGK